MSSNFNKYFIDLQSDFYHYMITYGSLTPKTARDYITRLRFLAESYILDMDISAEIVDEIIIAEDSIRLNRETYTTKHAMGDFRSGLNKFLAFVQFDYEKHFEFEIQNEVNKINESFELQETEKRIIIQSRIGQGIFRKNLLNYWNGCSFTGCDKNDLLIASHIKPWRDSDNKERLDYFNGLLLLPNYDKLFDKGYLTVSASGEYIFSKFLPEDSIEVLGLNKLVKIRVNEKHKPYLDYHNQFCFMG